MSIWYLPSSLAMRAVLLSGLEEAARSRKVRAFHAPKTIFFLLLLLLLLLLLILTAFKGKTASRGRLAIFGFRMSFV